MKVGKPKSKRTPVRLRHKIQKASTAKEKKRRKDAKKNPQWRSRLKKDPGIPNLFPYKAAVLAEIEENKRRKEEEAQRRRDLAKAQRQGKAVEVVERNTTSAGREVEDEELPDDFDEEDDMDEPMDEQDDSNPMAALLASAQARADTYAQDSEEDDDDDEDDENEWDGIEDTNPSIATAQLQQRGLPKQALSDPIKTITKLLDRVQEATGGLQLLLDFYQIPPLVTAGSDVTTRFLVEVARKRGRLGRGGVPNLHSAALIVLGDLHEERILLPRTQKRMQASTDKGEVTIVEKMAQPFRLEGLWGDEDDAGGAMVV